MKSIIILLLFILQSAVLPQNNFIQQITNGDFDARNPFIYKDGYGFYYDMFFELHKNGISNIYSIKYNSDTGLFGDTIALTSGNSLNINPSYSPNSGLLFQTNRNGNWDIMLLPDSNGVWKSPRFLTNSNSDEKSPKFFEAMSSWEDSARILFERDGKIVYLSIEPNRANEEIVFQNDPNITYYNFSGLQTENWGTTAGFYVYAIEDSSNHKKIVSRFKPFNNNSWQEKIIVKDSCDCSDLSLQIMDGLFYSDTLFDQKRYFLIQNPFISNASSELVQIDPNGNLSHFDLFTFLIVTKRSENLSPGYELYYPHTYVLEQNGVSKVRVDVSDLGFWGKDSLIQVTIPDPNLAIGPVGLKNGLLTIYTVWEDSVNGYIQLFGTPKHINFGSVNDESYVNDFFLYQNYPNPFNPATNIEYKILKGSEIRFNVINILGEKVFEQNFGFQSAGNYKIDFDGSSLSSGIYLYSIYTSENRLSRKMLLLK